jgi:ankyrin repeat protein
MWLALSLAALASTFAFAAHAQLIEATEAGDHAAALKLLEAGVDVNARGPDGTTPLMWAAYHGDVALTQRLLKAGAAVDARNRYGASALSEAATIGSASLIAALLDAGAAADAPNAEGETPLMVVARTGNVEAAKLLLDSGADVNAKEEWGGQTALIWAAAQSQPQMVRLLVNEGADVDARAVVRNWQRKVVKEPRPKDMNRGGLTPLLYAAREGCLECARHLLEGGADVDLADPENVTALSLALANLHFDLAAYLIGAGADVHRWDLFGRAPLYLAVDVSTLPVNGAGGMEYLPSADAHTALDIAKLLLERGANPNVQLKRRPPYLNVGQDRGADMIFSQGATPLLRAARAGDAEAVRLLLEYGAIADLPMAYGVTPLMAAAGLEYSLRITRGRYRTEESVLATLEMLVAAGADVDARMLTEPFSGLDYAGQVSQPDFRYASRGRQVPGVGAKLHRTALHGAAMRGFTFIVEFLAAHGAELEVEDADGKTALDLASGEYTEYFLRQKAQPHAETVALLEGLLEAKKKN